MRKPNGYWTVERLAESTKRFDTVVAWSQKHMGAYLAARRKGLLKQVTQHMLSHGESIARARTIWTKQECIKSARKYTKRSDWETGDHQAYQAAKRHGWYEECSAHMERAKEINGYWNFKNCLAEARRHSHIRDWAAASASSYQIAKANPAWFSECSRHMERLWLKKWSTAAVLADAKKYSTIQEWVRHSAGGYNAAWTKGLIRRATKHMVRSPKWFPVATIHRILQSYDIKYAEEVTFEDCRDRRKLPFDFYLPMLNLLIEHHGTQHQRGWQGRGADAIKRRDAIKRQYAKKKGFTYLEIREWEIRDPAEIENIIVSTIRTIRPRMRLKKRTLTTKEMVRTNVRGKFTLPELLAIATKYETRAKFKRGDESAYNFACRHGFIDELCGHMLTKGEAQSKALTKWTKARVIESAKRFRSSREWATKEGSAYNAALKQGWIDEASGHFPSRVGKWQFKDRQKRRKSKTPDEQDVSNSIAKR